jgi:hypothetical protein
MINEEDELKKGKKKTSMRIKISRHNRRKRKIGLREEENESRRGR